MNKQSGFIGDVTVALEDHGQDFLEFDVKDGCIVDTRPFQGWVWNGKRVADKLIYPGLRLDLVASDGVTMRLRYPVEAVRPLGAVRIGPLDV